MSAKGIQTILTYLAILLKQGLACFICLIWMTTANLRLPVLNPCVRLRRSIILVAWLSDKDFRGSSRILSTQKTKPPQILGRGVHHLLRSEYII